MKIGLEHNPENIYSDRDMDTDFEKNEDTSKAIAWKI